mgnify:CR=1 FL=1
MSDTRDETGSGAERVPSGDALHHLSARIGQELRTPLSAILGFGDLLLRTDLSDEQRRYAGAIKEAGTTLLGLLDDISRNPAAEAEHPASSSAFLLYGVVGGCVAGVEWEAEAKGVELRVEIGPGAPIMVHGDPRLTRRILEGALGDAVGDAGGGCVRLDVGPGPDRPGTVLFRITWSDDRAPSGDGPDLASYRSAIAAAGGRIGLAETADGPPVLWFELPLPEAAAGEESSF